MQLSDFPILSANIKESRIKSLDIVLADLTKGMAENAIANIDHKNAKDVLGRVVDDVWTKAVTDTVRGTAYTTMTEAERKLYFEITSAPYMHLVNSKLKLIEKSGVTAEFATKAKTFLTEIKPIADAVVHLKDKVQKRQPKAPEDIKARYLAPIAGMEAIMEVRRVLLDVTEEQYEDLKSYFAKTKNNKLDALIKLTDKLRDTCPNGKVPREHEAYQAFKTLNERHTDLKMALPRDAYEPVDAKAARRADYHEYPAIQRSADADASILKSATKDADFAREEFIYKNLKKLESVIDAKKNFDRIEVLASGFNISGLEASFRLHFKDKSRFDIKLQGVFVVNSYDTQFYRYPLTFSEVYLPNGTKMPRPSEQRVNEIFVKAV
jgi:hypothetical protein